VFAPSVRFNLPHIALRLAKQTGKIISINSSLLLPACQILEKFYKMEYNMCMDITGEDIYKR